MADISKINPNGTEYNLKDATARSAIENTNENIQSSITVPKASVVTVTDAAPINAEDITVDIEPIQDLHGYDKPWAGGAGKNKCPVEKLAGGNSNNFTLSAGSYTFSFRLLGSAKYSTSSIILYDSNDNAICAVRIYGVSVNSYMDAQFTLSESKTLHITNSNVIVGSGGYVIDNVQIENGGSRTTFAPYSNECPIEGWTGAELDRVGKNWLNPNTIKTGKVINYTNGAIMSNANYWTSDYIDVHDASYIACSGTAYFNSAEKWFYDKDKNPLQRAPLNVSVIPVPTGAYYYCFSRENEYSASDGMVERGNTVTPYEPYQHAQATITFGETVHGGKWHVTAGGTDKTHANIASYNGETINEPWLSSLDEYVAGATPTIGAQVVYPLTTPTTISTPKQNVPMLKGINTVSADCGDVSLKYQPDNVIGELKGEIQVANSFVAKMALREGSGAKDFSYGGWSFRIRIFRSMGQISLYVENISASNVTEQAVVKGFNDESDYRAPEELRPNFNLLQAATYTTPSGWAIQVYLKDDGYIMFTGIAPEVGASAPTSSNWNLVEPWATHQQAKDLFNN